MKPLSEKISQAIYKRSANPRDDGNALDADWQAGFFVGKLTEGSPELWDDNHPITVEWRRRGSPKKLTTGFKSWKAGFYAGVLKRILK